jgi:hypothetical protein
MPYRSPKKAFPADNMGKIDVSMLSDNSILCLIMTKGFSFGRKEGKARRLKVGCPRLACLFLSQIRDIW